ncbi:ferredoxin-type protein NapG [Canicola haemoglobinophilus]|uniref:Quinol dehydrogenase periplasmic component n=1 Tax=Canicola haemoglobinophilus TaxID=733 RepID=A0A1V4B2M5_9PAST|nr:ferredoxin-type protein NapG [Canicola haemoglobinophilus]MBN6711308.1 ferredoxin-type protein NapG [Canicola haemoglobinophilus]MBN6711917.1 ferredoxin-type protein NapG [Canicola haemoglobinophilus]OOS01534.1 ferredoxin-type protein NapG [Canicola haemoglobinophilus]STO59994.1 quinol dehydrogenase periplasmic component [Canicola haemoglobinophilus]
MKKIAFTPERRKFFRDTARTCGGLAGLGLLLGLQQNQSLARQGVALRPPGALADDKDFTAACIRCGQCVQACPYEMLHLASLLSSMEAGTPYFVAREKPCEMCEDIPCAKACPTGALDNQLDDISQAKMGLAVLLDHETCLNWQGLRCDVCYRVCPLIDKAITLEKHRNERTGKHAVFIPTVHSHACTGCGKCEEACVLEEAAIKVLPNALAKGMLGEHYRLGWEEKDKAGHSLAPEGLISLPVRQPESK